MKICIKQAKYDEAMFSNATPWTDKNEPHHWIASVWNIKQLGLHFASKQPKLMFRHFDCENGAAELTLKRVKPKWKQVLRKSSRNGTNSTVNADFRCQSRRSVWLRRLYSEQDNLFSVSHEIKCSQWQMQNLPLSKAWQYQSWDG